MSGDKDRIVATLQGNMDITIVTASSGRVYVESGDLKLIGLMSDVRIPGCDYPTLKEQGVDAVEIFKYVAYAPKNPPPATIEILKEAFAKAADDPEMLTEMTTLWMFPAHVGGEELKMDIDGDWRAYSTLAKDFAIVK